MIVEKYVLAKPYGFLASGNISNGFTASQSIGSSRPMALARSSSVVSRSIRATLTLPDWARPASLAYPAGVSSSILMPYFSVNGPSTHF